MNSLFVALVLLISFALGYFSCIAYLQLRNIWKLYVLGKEIRNRWDGEVVEIMSGDNDD